MMALGRHMESMRVRMLAADADAVERDPVKAAATHARGRWFETSRAHQLKARNLRGFVLRPQRAGSSCGRALEESQGGAARRRRLPLTRVS